MGMMGTPSARWRAVLRLAWRDAARHKGRTAVVVAMMMLPVFAATFLTTIVRSSTETTETMIQTRLGDEAQARLDPADCERVEQHPVSGSSICDHGDGEMDLATEDQILAALPPGSELVPEYTGQGSLRSEAALVEATWTQVDATAVPGLVPVRSGLAPEEGQVVLDSRTAERLGVGVGADLDLVVGEEERTVRIVGLAAPDRNPQVWAGVGTVPEQRREPAAWLAVGAPVTWAHTQALNEEGVLVFSRQVTLDPPADDEIPAGMGAGNWDATTVGLIGAVAAIGLVQAVLLIGPAFAVGARRSARTLALVAASGGRPRDLYRTVLASGLVAGGLAGMLGALLGLTAGVGTYLIVTRMGFAFPNLVLPTWELVLIAGLALLVGLSAAWIPARGAASTDVVAALAGRRSEATPQIGRAHV